MRRVCFPICWFAFFEGSFGETEVYARLAGVWLTRQISVHVYLGPGNGVTVIGETDETKIDSPDTDFDLHILEYMKHR